MQHPIVALYQDYIKAWNDRDVALVGGVYAHRAVQIGFNGTTLVGSEAVSAHFLRLFRGHQTGTMIGKVLEVRELNPDVALLRAIAGYIPLRRDRVDPRLSEVQTLICSSRDGRWHIELFQITPAALHASPDVENRLAQQLQDPAHSVLAI